MTETEMNEVSSGIYDVGDQTFVLSGGAIVEFGDTRPFGKEVSPLQKMTVNGNLLEYAAWGVDNNLPYEREELIMNNNIIPSLMEVKVDIIMGQDVILQKERFEMGKDGKTKRIVEECEMSKEMKDFIDAHEKDNEDGSLLEQAAKDYLMQAQYFPEYTRNVGGKIIDAQVIEAQYVRASKIKEVGYKHRIPSWLICGEWSKSRNRKVTVVKNYNRKKDYQPKYIKCVANRLFGGPYYFSPSYWGGRTWLKLSNLIPVFHLSNLANGYTPRFSIKVPVDFFWKMVSNKPVMSLHEDKKKEMRAKAKTKELEFKKKLNAVLIGAENAGRAIFTTYDLQKSMGKEYAGLIIEPISFDMRDEALLDLFDKSNDANISAQGVLPSISGVQTGGKLSSGSDIRNAYAFYLATRANRPRRSIYEVYNHPGRVNSWFTGKFSNCFFTGRDTVIVTTDKDASGTQDKKETISEQPKM